MKTIFKFLSVVLVLSIFTGCETADYQTTTGGMPFKYFKREDGKTAKPGDYVKINLRQIINDSVYFSTGGKLALYFPVPGKPKPYDLSEIWEFSRKGDSLMCIQMLDTFIRRFPSMISSDFKKGDRIISYIKVLDVFDSDSLRNLDEETDRKKLLSKEIEEIEKYLTENNIKAQKTPGGTYVEIMDPGKGNLIDSGNFISVMYRGMTFAGKTFDTNLDSSFGHLEPLSFTVGQGAMIIGFEEGAKLLRKNAVAKFYIPSLLAYGPNPGTDRIKPFENVIFEIKIVDVNAETPVEPKAALSPQVKTDTLKKRTN